MEIVQKDCGLELRMSQLNILKSAFSGQHRLRWGISEI